MTIDKVNFKTYKYKGNLYQVINNAMIMKHPTTREWVNCVQYHKLNDYSKMYIREASEFYERFKEI